MGGFEKEAKPIFHESTPKDYEAQGLKIDMDHFCKATFNLYTTTSG